MNDYETEIQAALKAFYGFVPKEIDLAKLKGDASTRSYYRLRVKDPSRSGLADDAPRSLIVMRLPESDFVSDEAMKGTSPKELPFLNVQRMLKKRGVPVPEVYLDNSSHRIVFLEDLGDETFEVRLKKQDRGARIHLYKRAVDLLTQLHKSVDSPDTECIAYNRKFDRELLLWELEHFREWGVEALRGELRATDRAFFDRIFSRIVSRLEEMPQGFMHRDFQSRNLMWVPRGQKEKLVIIDFQDAMIGPRPYDLVALLCDSYVDLDLDLQEEMVNYYRSQMGLSGSDGSDFHHSFWLVALHRKLKDAGRFVFIDRVRKNPEFLRFYPQSLRYVGRALVKLDGFEGLDALLKRLIPGFPDNVIEPVSSGRME